MDTTRRGFLVRAAAVPLAGAAFLLMADSAEAEGTVFANPTGKPGERPRVVKPDHWTKEEFVAEVGKLPFSDRIDLLEHWQRHADRFGVKQPKFRLRRTAPGNRREMSEYVWDLRKRVRAAKAAAGG